jgi:hypothetical protein
MARKRKTFYPPPKTATRGAPPADPGFTRTGIVAINVHARAGREGLVVGDRVRISGTGLYAGEIATIERFAGSAVPVAVVRTEAGRTRQVRTVDLEPVTDEVERA